MKISYLFWEQNHNMSSLLYCTDSISVYVVTSMTSSGQEFYSVPDPTLKSVVTWNVVREK